VTMMLDFGRSSRPCFRDANGYISMAIRGRDH
jgi:hypothetical protein